MADEFPLKAPTHSHRTAFRTAWASGGACETIVAGKRWFRIVRARNAAQAQDYAATANPTAALARFSPIVDAAGNVVPSAYAGEAAKVALWEVVLRNVRHSRIKAVPHHELVDRYLFEVELLRDTMLVNVRRPANQQLALDGEPAPDLHAERPSAYRTTGAWAQMLYEESSGYGLLYESHQVPGSCIVLYEPVPGRALFKVVHALGPVSQGQPRRLLRQSAQEAGVSIDFGSVAGDDDED